MAFLITLFGLLTACTEYSLHPVTDLMYEDKIPDIEVWPDEVDFGKVYNEKLSVSVIVSNVGQGILDIDEVSLTSLPSYNIESIGDTVIWPGKSMEVVVSFEPIDNKVHNSKLKIVSNDPDEPWKQVNLVGEGVIPQIDVTPLAHDFGTLEAGCEDVEMIQITNLGDADLIVSQIQDSMNDGDLVIDKLSFPLTIKPTEVIRLNAAYRPVEEAHDFGTIFIDSNDPNKPTVQVTLDGTGVVAGYGLDTFVQPETRKTDIVFALDRSCSMSPDLAAVEGNFTAFLNSLSSVNADYNIGVAIADDGCFSGGVWIDETQTYVDQLLFLNDMMYGVTAFPGNYTERAFNLFEAALNPVNLGTGDCNEGFLRDDALLALIGVSDEDDQSYDYWLDYVLYFQGLKADPADVVFHAIGGDAPDGGACAMYYAGMYEAVAWTGGQFISICEPDYSAALTAIAEGSVNVMTGFPLSDAPIPETIVVRVDGVVQKSGWNYDYNSNEVVFQTNYIPVGGSFIEIEYTITGDCN